MTIKEANNKLEKIDNDIEYYLKEKENLLVKVEPKALDTTKEVVSGGKRADRFLNYTIELETIDTLLDELYAKKKNLESYIEKELHRLNKYREVEQLIIYYKEQSLENLTWEEISRKVHYSKTQCRRIYQKWKGKREID